MTEIREPNFGVDLPGEWEKAESPEPHVMVYRDKRGEAGLSVTLLGVRPVFAIADQRRLLDDYIHHRSKYEQGRTPSLEQSEGVAEQHGESVVGSWAGSDPETGRRMQHHVVLVDALLVDFVYEAPETDEAAFAERADAAFATVTVSAS